MLGLQHHSHPALAELVEDEVARHRQRLPLARIDHLSLIRADLLVAYQPLGQLLAIRRLRLSGQLSHVILKITLSHHATLNQVHRKSLQRNGGHSVSPSLWTTRLQRTLRSNVISLIHDEANLTKLQDTMRAIDFKQTRTQPRLALRTMIRTGTLATVTSCQAARGIAKFLPSNAGRAVLTTSADSAISRATWVALIRFARKEPR